MPKLIVLFYGVESPASTLAEAAADGAKAVRFTEVDVRAGSSHEPTTGRRHKSLDSAERLKDYDGVVLAAPAAGETPVELDALLGTLERAEPVGVFANTVFAVLGGDNTTLLGSVARLGGIIVTEPSAWTIPRVARGRRGSASPRSWNGCGMRRATSSRTRTHQSTITTIIRSRRPSRSPLDRSGRAGTKSPEQLLGAFSAFATCSIDKFDGYWLLDQACSHAALEEKANSLAAAIAVVERPVVDVHPDEGVGLGSIEAAGVLHRVVERAAPMLQSVRDTVM